MDTGPVWLAGLRRFHAAGALGRYVEEGGVTGAVWAPDALLIEDWAAALLRLVEAGARPDAALLWDLVSADVRAAAARLAPVNRTMEGADGWVAFWLPPDRLQDQSRGSAYALEAQADAGGANVAVAFAWVPARAGLLSAILAEGVPVALSGVTDAGAVEQVSRARERGVQKLREEDEDAADVEVPVFLLGAGPAGSDEWTRRVTLVHELDVASSMQTAHAARVPSTPEEERAAFDALLASLAARAKQPLRDDGPAPEEFAASAVQAAVSLARADVGPRMWARDHTVWKPEPDEITNRLGWLDVVNLMSERTAEINAFAREARAGVSRVVLLGMGGSSLGAEMLHASLGGGLPLTVLDTTDPDYVGSVRSSIDPDATLFVAASKSGTTTETLAHLDYFWAACPRGERWIAITDTGTPLASLAAERSFRRVFENPPDIGGRFSVLSYFGLVPAALSGVGIESVLQSARAMAARSAPSVPAPDSPGLRLAAAIGDAVRDRRDKLTIVLPPAIASFGAWLEQLVAESTGKQGRGVVPVDGEDLGPLSLYGDDRLFVAYALGDAPHPAALAAVEAEHPVIRMRIPDPLAVGAEAYRWEVAIAALGHVLDINPFDQPDVEFAKQRTRERLDGGGGPVDQGSPSDVLDGLAPPSWIGIQAFIAPTREHADRLQAVRLRLRDRHKVATTVGFGPRFLHSTGQLHKGGADTGVFLQVTGPHATDVEIPGRSYTFGRLVDAQADGDLQALRDAGRRAVRMTIEQLEGL